ncbi:DUF1763-domain-containing protein [Hyaloscypha variabilis F]|uniref:DUF1763-domain-containing protein n=1 Tax=Hyaloscypha variabilis (strain UAMH 11265 / GT02V1 / F) TaxID=1149755 RepID=A0A2J6S2P7_HYAVF|nr:DUF1763-domain-containing protein [Hyaloscypha variabilis F]
MSTPSPQEVTHAYRHLYRGLLRAVQFSKPARYVARDQLRRAFRTEHPSSFNQEKIDRTVEFLGFAAKEAGLEHRIVRNLLHTAYWEQKKYIFVKYRRPTTIQRQIQGTAKLHYQMTLAMLNDSMGLCLR